MRDFIFISLITLFSIFGIVFIASGMTGNVVSESCCFGPGCASDNLCDSAKPAQQEDFSGIYVGLIMIFTSIVLVVNYIESAPKPKI